MTLRLPEFWLAVRRDRDYEWLLQRKHHAFSRSLLRSGGVGDVIVDNGSIADEIQRKFPGGVDKVLEMIGTVTLEDSLHCAKQGGVVCMTGIVGNQWTLDRFAPNGCHSDWRLSHGVRWRL